MSTPHAGTARVGRRNLTRLVEESHEIVDAVERRLGVQILQGYCCTESSAVISASTLRRRRTPHQRR